MQLNSKISNILLLNKTGQGKAYLKSLIVKVILEILYSYTYINGLLCKHAKDLSIVVEVVSTNTCKQKEIQILSRYFKLFHFNVKSVRYLNYFFCFILYNTVGIHMYRCLISFLAEFYFKILKQKKTTDYLYSIQRYLNIIYISTFSIFFFCNKRISLLHIKISLSEIPML